MLSVTQTLNQSSSFSPVSQSLICMSPSSPYPITASIHVLHCGRGFSSQAVRSNRGKCSGHPFCTSPPRFISQRGSWVSRPHTRTGAVMMRVAVVVLLFLTGKTLGQFACLTFANMWPIYLSEPETALMIHSSAAILFFHYITAVFI